MEKILNLLIELEEEIVETNTYRRCQAFDKDCVQCQFWARFDWIKKDLIDLNNAINSMDFSAIEVIGHKLGGNAGGYGLHLLGEYGSQLELAAQTNNMDIVVELISKIKNYLNRLEIKFE